MFQFIKYSQILDSLFLMSVFKNHLKPILDTIYRTFCPTQRRSIMKIVFVGFGIFLFAHPAVSEDIDARHYKFVIRDYSSEAPVSGADLCMTMQTIDKILNECFEIADGKIFPEYRATFCVFIRQNSTAMECLRVISEKKPNKNEVVICDDTESDFLAVECLKTISGKDLPEYGVIICQEMPDYKGLFNRATKLDCFKLIAEKSLSEDGAVICEDMSTHNKVMECLEVVAGKPLSEDGVVICEDMPNDNKVIECLKVIAGKGLPEIGVVMCEDMSNVNNVIKCLEAIAGKTLVETGVSICEDMPSDKWKIDCLKMIAGEIGFSQKKIDNCKKKGAPHLQLTCLRDLNPDPSREEIEIDHCKKGKHYSQSRCLRDLNKDSSRSLSQKKSLGEAISDFFRKVWAVF